MTKDRTEELRSVSANVSQKPKKSPWGKENPEELVSLTSSYKLPIIAKSSKKEQESLDSVFKQVNLLNSWIQSVKEDTMMLKQCHRIAQHSTRTETSTKDKISELMANIRSYSSRTKGGLEELKKRKERHQDTAIKRVIETQHSNLSKTFSDAMEDYQLTLAEYRTRNEDLIKKHLLIVVGLVLKGLPIVPADKEVTSEQLTSMLDSEDTAIFVDNFLKDTAVARQQLQEARNRHREILEIEKEITEIRDLFFDVATQVHNQGELIDRIEYHIGKGKDQAHVGARELDKAVIKRAKARKKKIILWICLSVVFGVIFLYLLIQFSSPKD